MTDARRPVAAPPAPPGVHPGGAADLSHRPPPPKPAAPAGRIVPVVDASSMSPTARGVVRVADALPDWLGSVRFRLTAIYSLVLFGLAAFMAQMRWADLLMPCSSSNL